MNVIIPTASAESETVVFKVGRKRFNSLLHNLLGSPSDNGWGKADLLIKDKDLLKTIRIEGDVDYVEVLTGTPVAPVLAIHLTFPDDAVVVAMPRPTEGIYRLADQIIAEMRGDEA